MSLVMLTCGWAMNVSQSHVTGFCTSPSHTSFHFARSTVGVTPRSSTGQSSTLRWPGGRRCAGGALWPVNSLPSRAHACLERISFSLIAPVFGVSSSAMPLSPIPQQPSALTLPIALLLALALVALVLALGDAELDLGDAARVEIDLERHQRHAGALRQAAQLVDLAPVQQQF